MQWTVVGRRLYYWVHSDNGDGEEGYKYQGIIPVIFLSIVLPKNKISRPLNTFFLLFPFFITFIGLILSSEPNAAEIFTSAMKVSNF